MYMKCYWTYVFLKVQIGYNNLTLKMQVNNHVDRIDENQTKNIYDLYEWQYFRTIL